MAWRELEEYAAGQFNVIRVRDAGKFDVSPRTLWRTAKNRDWGPDVAGIVWLPGPETPERWLMTGQLLVGEHGAITDWSALYVMGYVATSPTKVHLVVPYGCAIPTHERFSVRRSRTLEPQDFMEHGELRLTVIERTLNQMAGVNDLGTLRGFALDARQRGDLEIQTWFECMERMGRYPGWRTGLTVAQQIDANESDSVFEFLMRRRLNEAGFHPDEEQFKLQTPHRVLKLDIAWAAYCVGLECDSLKHHGSRTDLDRDARRHNAAQGTDWTVLRATWTHVDDDKAFAELCADLRAAFRRAGHPNP